MITENIEYVVTCGSTKIAVISAPRPMSTPGDVIGAQRNTYANTKPNAVQNILNANTENGVAMRTSPLAFLAKVVSVDFDIARISLECIACGRKSI